MLGNCREWCLDLQYKVGNDYQWTSKDEPEINPVGAAKEEGYVVSGHYYHVVRSSDPTQNYIQNNICVRLHRLGHTFSGSRNDFGFRVGCMAE